MDYPKPFCLSPLCPSPSSSSQNTIPTATPTPSPSLHRCVASFKTPATITCLAAHRTFLYAASLDHINVFDLASLAHLDSFACASPSSGAVKSIAFSGQTILTAHQDSKIRVWGPHPSPSGRRRRRLLSTLPTVKDRLLRSVLPGNYVRVRRHEKQLWISHSDAVSGLVVSNGLIYSVSWDKSFKVWRASDRRCLESVAAHQDAVNAVAVSADGTVYTASADGRIRVWEMGNDCSHNRSNRQRPGHRLTATLVRHESAVNALALSEGGKVLVSGGSDRSILVWERSDGGRVEVSEVLEGHCGAVLCLASVGPVVVSGSGDLTVRVWARGGRVSRCGYLCVAVLEGHAKAVKSLVAFYSLSDSEELLSSADNETARGREDDVDDAITICSGSLDGEIKVWEVRV